MSTGAILTAAGSGSRLGSALPKALVELDGVPLVAHAARRLAESGLVRALVIMCPPGFAERVFDAVAPFCTIPFTVVDGGATRQASVAAGLAALADVDDVVLVHDAARPLASVDLIGRLVAAIEAGFDAVVPGIPVVDTIKEVDGSAVPRALATLRRSRLRAIQTPQAFRTAVLVAAHTAGAHRARSEESAASDDAALVESAGTVVHVIEGEDCAMKITTARDLAIAALLLEESR
ncbi:MAG: 2-C-methyl-D-erythritol 4-phosphate cytidylyltransferase [Actinomycetales bacterium]|nr:2-C-methyl-D-erythritol 4-phosphate cytidylyltransferase [Actinomycetales bacterium]